jgi:hypothetical protein
MSNKSLAKHTVKRKIMLFHNQYTILSIAQRKLFFWTDRATSSRVYFENVSTTDEPSGNDLNKEKGKQDNLPKNCNKSYYSNNKNTKVRIFYKILQTVYSYSIHSDPQSNMLNNGP